MNHFARIGILLLAATVAACAGAPRIADREPPDRSIDDLVDRPDRAIAGTPEERLREALAFVRNNQLDAAERELAALAAEYPEHSGALTNLGILQAKAGRHTDAINSLSEAVSRNPQNIVAMNWLGHSHRANRQPERAERAWLDALRVDPDYTAAHVNLGMLYEDALGDARRAIRHYRAAYDSSGQNELRVLPWIAQLEARMERNDGQQAAVNTGTATESRQ